MDLGNISSLLHLPHNLFLSSSSPLPMSKGRISVICNDRVKYMLLNAVETATKGVVIPRVYCRARTRLFASMHRIQNSALKSTAKPKHLYVIPYARYYTLRQILYDRGDELETEEDDEELKAKFSIMMNKPHVSRQALENEFLEHIKALKSPQVYSLYVDLDHKILTTPLSEDEMICFVEATSETDIFIAKKLTKDVALYITRKEKLLQFLREYRFVNGWITAAGVGLMTAAMSVESIKALVRHKKADTSFSIFVHITTPVVSYSIVCLASRSGEHPLPCMRPSDVWSTSHLLCVIITMI